MKNIWSTELLSLLLLIIIIDSSYVIAKSFGTSLKISDQNLLETHDSKNNIFIVDFRNNDNSKRKFELICESGPNSLDLNLTFTGFNSIHENLPANEVNILGKKKLTLVLNPPLLAEYTGRYTCTSLNKNNVIETVSWYVYFYPGKEI